MKSPAVSVLDRYLVRELTAPFALGVVLFTFFLIIDRIYQLTDLVISKGVPLHLVGQLLVFMLPSFLGLTLPMAFLVAVLIAGGRLAGDLEIVACKAAGVSLYRLFRPVAAAALVVATVTAALTLVVNPVSNREFQRQLLTILQTRASTGLKERVFNTTFNGVTIYVEEVSPSQVALSGVLVSDERDPKLTRIVAAREGRLLTDEATHRVTLRLLNGAVNEADVTPADPPKAVAGDEVAPSGAASAGRYRYTRFGIYDMNLTVQSALATAQKGNKPEKDMPFGELERKIREARGDPAAQTPLLVERHKRYAFPVAALVFALVGFPLAVRSHRGGRSIALVASLAIIVTYYLVLTSLEGLALSRRLPAWFAIWLPNIGFAAAGLVLLVRTARERRFVRLTAFWRVVDWAWQRAPRRPTLRLRRAALVRESTHIIDRYLVREFVMFIAIGLAVAATLSFMVDLLKTLDRYLRVKPPIAYILEHFVYTLPEYVYIGLPIVMLIATVFLFLTLTRYHELTALKAAGVSLYRVSAPVLLVGLSVAVLAGLFQETLLPRLRERGDEVDRVKIKGQLPKHLQSQSRLWLRSSDTRFYRVELLAPGSQELYGVTVLEIDRDFRLVNRLDARLARWTAAGWEFSDGAVRDIRPDGQVETVPFVRTALDLPETINDFVDIQKPVEAMNYREMREYVSRLEAAGFQVRKYLVTLYSKLSSPLENLIMVLIAIPFSLQAPRGGRLVGISLAIGIMAGYLVVHNVAVVLAQSDLLPPLLGAWTANIIFLGIGVSLFARART